MNDTFIGFYIFFFTFDKLFSVGVDRYEFFRADANYYRSSRLITDILCKGTSCWRTAHKAIDSLHAKNYFIGISFLKMTDTINQKYT